MKRLVLLLPLLASCAGGHRAFEPLLAAEDARTADDRLLAALRSEDPALRARAATALGRIMTPACVDPLLPRLADPDAGVRRAAAFALGQLGWRAEFSGGREAEIAARLSPLLADPDERIRAAAAEAVGKTALLETATLVLPLLRDPSPTVRAEAALALFRHRYVLRLRDLKAAPAPELPREALDALLALATDSDPFVRRNVAYYFVRAKDPRGIVALEDLAADPDLWVRFHALTAIGRTGEASAAPAAAKACGDPEYLVRLAAVQALGALKSAGLIPPALESDPSHHVRAALADAIGGSDIADDSPLVRLWKDESPAVRCAALKGLIARRKSAERTLLDLALQHDNRLVREAAVEACASLEADAEEPLLAALKDRDEIVRATAIDGLSKIETPTAFAAIRAALSAPGLAERGTAVEALKARKEPEALEAARACYDACLDRAWIEVRESLVGVFAEKADDEALRKALRDPAPSVAQKAKRALKARGAADLPELPEPPRTTSPHAGLRFGRNPRVLLETDEGTMTIECLSDEAPVHVANFIGLVRKGFYDGLPWHRVVPGFVIQGGDPLGNGWGDAGWSLRAEINGARFERGALGMPRSEGFDTGGCQLFITHAPTPHLDGLYTVFGRVVEGLEVVDRIERDDRILRASVLR